MRVKNCVCRKSGLVLAITAALGASIVSTAHATESSNSYSLGLVKLESGDAFELHEESMFLGKVVKTVIDKKHLVLNKLLGGKTVSPGKPNSPDAQEPTPPVVAEPTPPVTVTPPIVAEPAPNLPPLQDWMSPEVRDAWESGFKGQGVTVTIVDDFSSDRTRSGDLGVGLKDQRHGEWARDVISAIATEANIRDRSSSRRSEMVLLDSNRANVVNVSYGLMGPSSISGEIQWDQQEQSIISHAHNGRAIVVKSAGNDGVSMLMANSEGNVDFLARDLVGGQTTLFVGALDKHGTSSDRATITEYSNRAGQNNAIQDQFLMVGMPSSTGLDGTSFAAAQVSAYSAIVGSKFATASPVQITEQLLSTSRTDTINNYDRAVHGRGEASLTRALAPASIR